MWVDLTTLLAVYDGSDNLLMRFECADGRMPAAMTKAGQRYYFAYDQVGTLRVVTDAAGAVVKRVDYDTFGNIIADTNPAFAVPFGFAGGLHDLDTGLVRFGYRDYDPNTGRWTAKDPIGFAGGDTDLYGYCLGDPVNLTDPFGLWPPASPQGNNMINSYNHFNNGGGLPDIDIPSIGDMISYDNGNLFPGFKEQDCKCSLPGPLGDIADKYVLTDASSMIIVMNRTSVMPLHGYRVD